MNRRLSRMMWLLLVVPLAVGCSGTAADWPGPWAPSEDKADAVKGNTAFALDLYAQLRARDGNLFFSPQSISMALGMTYGGARDKTADEMAHALHLTLPADRLHPALGSLLHDLSSGKNKGYRIHMANALWGQKDHPFKEELLRLLATNYGAAVQPTDFAGDPEKARQAINARVERQTEDRIKDLLGPGDITTITRLVLTNAVYFKGDWATQFPKGLTREGPFHVTAKDTVPAPLMHLTAKLPYAETDKFQVLEVPYAGNHLSMVILLPKKVDGLVEIEKELTPAVLSKALASLKESEVAVTLPRFKATCSFSLKDALERLGMHLAFTNEADFSGLDGTHELKVSAVIHKAFVDVNEEGTEAAAATGVVFARTPGPIHHHTVFQADHPFLFLIRDRRTDSIVFLGRLASPQK